MNAKALSTRSRVSPEQNRLLGQNAYSDRVNEYRGEPVARAHHGFTIWYAVIGALALVAVLVGAVTYEVRHEYASTACGFTPPSREELPGSGWHVDWGWWPPGFVCVYTDERGNVVARRRP